MALWVSAAMVLFVPSVSAITYEYDELSRVKKVVYEDGASIIYDYDAAGNITGVQYLGVMKVSVDIKPGGCPNPLNLKSKGVLPVAVLGTLQFDVTSIDPASIRLSCEEVAGEVAPIGYEDIATSYQGDLCGCNQNNGDGYLDLSLKFDTQSIAQTLRPTEFTK